MTTDVYCNLDYTRTTCSDVIALLTLHMEIYIY